LHYLNGKAEAEIFLPEGLRQEQIAALEMAIKHLLQENKFFSVIHLHQQRAP